MEASMLVAPKPSRLLPSASRRAPSARRSSAVVVVASAGDGDVKAASSTPGGRGGAHHRGALAMAASVVVGAGFAALPCHASGATLPTPEMHCYCRAAAAAVVLAELDPAAAAKAAIPVAGPALSALGLLFVARIVMSWYPRLPVTEFPYVVAYAPTEPLLAATRKVIPPLAGVDVTPVVWFGLVSFLNEILVGPHGLLVLLSQQVSSSS